MSTQEPRKRKRCLDTDEAWSQLDPYNHDLNAREEKNVCRIIQECFQSKYWRHVKVVDVLCQILSRSQGAAVLVAARLGQTNIMNMKNDTIEALKNMIDTHAAIFESPKLGETFKRLNLSDLEVKPKPNNPSLGIGHSFNIDAHEADTQQKNVGGSQRTSGSIFLLCVGTPADKDIAKCDLLGVPISLNEVEVFKDDHLPATFNRKDIDKMKEGLGSTFIGELGDKRFIHQMIVGTLFARTVDGVEAEFQPWTWFINKIRQKGKTDLLDYFQKKKASNVLILLSNTNLDWQDMSISDVYGQIRLLTAYDGNISVYPRESEVQWAGCKIGDIQALDKIAQDADWKYSYRPKTCPGLRDCKLPSKTVKRMVIKRTFSCGAGHVKVVEGTSRDKLACKEPSMKPRNVNKKEPVYFHQEYVDSLRTFGEYQIFICQGKILSRAYAKREWDDEGDGGPANLAVVPMELRHFSWFSNDVEEQKQKSKELDDFALFEYSELLQQPRFSENYGSLLVGMRLDVGISELNSDGRFFVQEPTRHWGADQASELHMKEKPTTIAKEWMLAVIGQYKASLRATKYGG